MNKLLIGTYDSQLAAMEYLARHSKRFRLKNKTKVPISHFQQLVRRYTSDGAWIENWVNIYFVDHAEKSTVFINDLDL